MGISEEFRISRLQVMWSVYQHCIWVHFSEITLSCNELRDTREEKHASVEVRHDVQALTCEGVHRTGRPLSNPSANIERKTLTVTTELDA